MTGFASNLILVDLDIYTPHIMIYDAFFLVCYSSPSYPVPFLVSTCTGCRKLRLLSPLYVSVGFLSLFYKIWLI